MVEVPYALGDEVDRLDDAGLLAQIRRELAQLEVPLEDDPPLVFSVRAPEAYPVHLRQAAQARAAAFAALTRCENLSTFGRQGSFRFVFADAAMRMGFRAAEGVLAGALPSHAELSEVQSRKTLTEVASLVEEGTLRGVGRGEE